MRSILLTIMIFVMIPMCIGSPIAGLIVWQWVALMTPHAEIFGFGKQIPFNLIVAISALIGLAFSSDRKVPPNHIVVWLIGLLGVWGAMSTYHSYTPEISLVIWDRLWKTLLLALVVTIVANSRQRIHALIWTIVISLGYYGLRGGVYWFASLGNYHLSGPARTMISDNNHLALAVTMSIPLVMHLRKFSANQTTRLGMGILAIASILCVIGTYSRGGLIGLVATMGFYVVVTGNKVRLVVLAVPVIFLVIAMAPDAWFDRMETISSATEDSSFMGRVESWKVHFEAARQNPVLGAGFWATQQPEYLRAHIPQATRAVAAHSIYFQVMADMGFFGLAIFLSLLFFSWRSLSHVVQAGKHKPEYQWMSHLALMLKCSLVGYLVSGAALSMAYYDLVYTLCGLSAALAVLAPLGPHKKTESNYNQP